MRTNLKTYGLHPRLWLLVELKILIRNGISYNNTIFFKCVLYR